MQGQAQNMIGQEVNLGYDTSRFRGYVLAQDSRVGVLVPQRLPKEGQSYDWGTPRQVVGVALP